MKRIRFHHSGIAAVVPMCVIILAFGAVHSVEKKGAARDENAKPVVKDPAPPSEKVVKSDAEWRSVLTPEQYRITRLKGTERPFTGKYNDFKGDGVFVCVCCGNELFDSNTKYESHTGWPSFWAPVDEKHVGKTRDASYGMIRTELVCNRCDAHLGHVFRDGPAPTGLRYCINSASLRFVEREKAEPESE